MRPSFWSSRAGDRISRRRALQAGAIAAAGAAALPIVGCNDGAAPAAADPHIGGTLRYGTALPLSYGLDPHLEQGGGLPIIARHYGYLFHVDSRDDTLTLDHAYSVEHPDANVYVIRLEEHRFHDTAPANGRTVTGDDVVLSMWRFRDHPLVVSKWFHTAMLDANGSPASDTVIVTTKRPYAYSLLELGSINAGAILPKEALSPPAELRDGVSGSGPMQHSGALSADAISLARFDGFAPPAYLDAMEWRTYASDAEKANAFRDRLADVIVAKNRAEADAFAARDVEIVSEPSLAWTSIGLRLDRPPFTDERVRRAIDIAIDRQALIADAAGGEGDITGPVNPHLAAGYWSLPSEDIAAAQGQGSIDARRNEARAWLAAAGASGATIRLSVSDVPEQLDLATLLAEQLRTVGLGLEIEHLTRAAWFFSYHGGNFDAVLISHPPYESPDAALRLYHSAGPDGTGSPFAFANPAIDALIERSWAEQDREARRSLVLDAQRLALEARPLVHLFAGTAYTLARKYVHDTGLDLPGSASRYAYRQWLELPVQGRPD